MLRFAQHDSAIFSHLRRQAVPLLVVEAGLTLPAAPLFSDGKRAA